MRTPSKYLLSSLLVTIILLQVSTPLWAESLPEQDVNSIKVRVNNVVLTSDVSPYINQANRVMLPLRAVAEALDCQVSWENKRHLL